MSKLPDIPFTDHAKERMDNLAPEDRWLIAERLGDVYKYPNQYLERLMLYEGDKYKYYNLHKFDARDFIVIVSYDGRFGRIIRVVEILNEDQVISNSPEVEDYLEDPKLKKDLKEFLVYFDKYFED